MVLICKHYLNFLWFRTFDQSSHVYLIILNKFNHKTNTIHQRVYQRVLWLVLVYKWSTMGLQYNNRAQVEEATVLKRISQCLFPKKLDLPQTRASVYSSQLWVICFLSLSLLPNISASQTFLSPSLTVYLFISLAGIKTFVFTFFYWTTLSKCTVWMLIINVI